MSDGSNSLQRCEQVCGAEPAEPPSSLKASPRCNFGEVEFP
jgi:hypothetical protein